MIIIDTIWGEQREDLVDLITVHMQDHSFIAKSLLEPIHIQDILQRKEDIISPIMMLTT